VTRFPFAFDLAALPLRLLGIAPSTAWVQVDDDEFAARFGPWRCRTDLANVRDVVVTRDHHAIRAIGPRVSLTDRGATFGTSAAAGVCVTFHEPVAAITPLAIHPGLTVTVADVDGLADLLRERCGPAT
jgi:hypothetical protein